MLPEQGRKNLMKIKDVARNSLHKFFVSLLQELEVLTKKATWKRKFIPIELQYERVASAVCKSFTNYQKLLFLVSFKTRFIGKLTFDFTKKVHRVETSQCHEGIKCHFHGPLKMVRATQAVFLLSKSRAPFLKFFWLAQNTRKNTLKKFFSLWIWLSYLCGNLLYFSYSP